MKAVRKQSYGESETCACTGYTEQVAQSYAAPAQNSSRHQTGQQHDTQCAVSVSRPFRARGCVTALSSPPGMLYTAPTAQVSSCQCHSSCRLPTTQRQMRYLHGWGDTSITPPRPPAYRPAPPKDCWQSARAAWQVDAQPYPRALLHWHSFSAPASMMRGRPYS
jgi:hypothetical protein